MRGLGQLFILISVGMGCAIACGGPGMSVMPNVPWWQHLTCIILFVAGIFMSGSRDNDDDDNDNEESTYPDYHQ